MHEFFFIMGFIRILTGISSILLGPFVGFDRSKIENEVLGFYKNQLGFSIKKILILVFLFFATLGFLIPAIYPVIGFIFGVVFFLFV
jgi:hypothetical protein